MYTSLRCWGCMATMNVHLTEVLGSMATMNVHLTEMLGSMATMNVHPTEVLGVHDHNECTPH